MIYVKDEASPFDSFEFVMMNATLRSRRGNRSATLIGASGIRVLKRGRLLQVWLRLNGRRIRVGTPLDMALVCDARRRGQDLIQELIDEAGRLAERGVRARPIPARLRSNVPTAAPTAAVRKKKRG